MALFTRANLNMLSLLNYCSCKFTTGRIKLKSHKRTSISSNLTQEKINNRNIWKETERFNHKHTPFEIGIVNRRDEACRSILVQVYSSNSYDDLQNYCAQFGKILSMHHFRINKQNDYILIEFRDVSAVNEMLSYASFMNSNSVIPVRSPVLWFRKGKFVGSRNNQKKIGLSVENGCMCPTNNEIATLLYNAKSISGQIIDLYEALKLSDLEIRLRFHTAFHLEQYFSGLFQNMKVLPFGSSINGFGRKRCDLDLVLITKNIKEENTQPNYESRLVFHAKLMKISERHETKEFLGILASAMYHFIPGISNIRKILEARVPIIKFNYEYTHLDCDLSTTNMSAIYMSELLNLYGEIDWRVRPLVITIRKWAKIEEITSEVPGQWITNFSLSLLVLFYLQHKNILPSLKELKSYATHDDIRCTENGIDCTFLRDINKLPVQYKYKANQDTLQTLLYGFFEYYSTFDFFTKGICIRESVPIRKPSQSPLHITNPLETALNVSKNVNIYELNRLTQKIHNALFTLETSDKLDSSSWGLLGLLKMKVRINTLDITNLSNIEEENIKSHSENYSSEVSNKYLTETDVSLPKQDKGTV